MSEPPGRYWVRFFLTVVAVWGAIACHVAWRLPVPAVNEPHYLAKSLQYWRPDWVAGDFYLESSNPHQFFYQTFGLLTKYTSLETAAIVGRVMAHGLLAIGWTALVLPIAGSPLLTTCSICVYLLLATAGSWSGEWIVGGVESKVPGYALVFLAWGLGLRGRLLAAAICGGLAVSFHPVVGMWAVLVTAAAMMSRFIWRMPEQDTNPAFSAKERPGPAKLFLSGVLFCLCSLPGLIPAWNSMKGASPDVVSQAVLIQVQTRLPHHLDPLAFPITAYRYYFLLLTLWYFFSRDDNPSPARTLWRRIVLVAVGVFAVGWMLGYGSRPFPTMPAGEFRASLLRYYPFRLADGLVPIAVAIDAVRWGGLQQPFSVKKWFVPMFACGAYLLACVLTGADRNPSKLDDQKLKSWQETLIWIRDNTPKDAVLYAVNERWAVRWYSHRAEYVNFKDCPQDPAGIVEWNRRLNLVREYLTTAGNDNFLSREEFSELHRQTGITHLIASQFPPTEIPPAHAVDLFQVFDIRPQQK